MGAALAAFGQVLAGIVRLLAHLPQWALAVSETFVGLPAVVLCVVSCMGLVEGKRGRLLRTSIPIAAVLLTVEGLLCSAHNLPTWPLSMLDLLVFFPLYIRISGLTPARAAFVVMTNVFVAVDIVYYAAVVDALAVGDELSAVYLAWPGLVIQWLLWAIALPILWHAARKVMPHSLTSPVVGERAWRTLWLMPTVLTLVVQVLRPGDVWIYGLDRVARDAIVFMTVVSALAVMTYLQMWRLMCQSERRIQTERELRRAELAREQVAHLDERIEASRRQRHDLRHHVHALQALLSQGDADMARSYLAELDDDIRLEEAPIRYCDNPAVNTALVYYCDAACRAGAQVDVSARVPYEPVQRQIDVVKRRERPARAGCRGKRPAHPARAHRRAARGSLRDCGQQLPARARASRRRWVRLHQARVARPGPAVRARGGQAYRRRGPLRARWVRFPRVRLAWYRGGR